jgi:hypothetical protein
MGYRQFYDVLNKAHNLVLTFNHLSTTECTYLRLYMFHGRVDLIQSLLAGVFKLLLQ